MGKPVANSAEAALAPGDEVTIGRYVLRVAPADPSPPWRPTVNSRGARSCRQKKPPLKNPRERADSGKAAAPAITAAPTRKSSSARSSKVWGCPISKFPEA